MIEPISGIPADDRIDFIAPKNAILIGITPERDRNVVACGRIKLKRQTKLPNIVPVGGERNIGNRFRVGIYRRRRHVNGNRTGNTSNEKE